MGRQRVALRVEGEEQTRGLAARLARGLRPSSLLALSGPLGSGKTTFVRGLAEGLGGEALVQSPTFVYLHAYPTSPPLLHFDLYRLSSEAQFLAMGFEEQLHAEAIVAIEWPERIASLLPSTALCVQFNVLSLSQRWICLEVGEER